MAFTLSAVRAEKIANEDCMTCHEDLQKELEEGGVRPLTIFSATFTASVHGAADMACVDCHSDILELPHADNLAPVKCGECHEDAQKVYQGSVHGIAVSATGAGEAASCVSCHGSHDIFSASDTRSRLHHHNLASTCIRCHEDQALIEKHKLPSQENIQTYVISVHGQSNVGDVASHAATCNDCHGWHNIQKASSPEATVSRTRVAETCGQCHADVLEQYYDGVHGSLAKEGNPDVPVCTDCHGEHQIRSPEDRQSTVSKYKIAETCGRCHENQEIVKKYNIPISSPSVMYLESVHGKALVTGSNPAAAACQDCHGHHSIHAGNHPNSTVNREKIPETCGKCHQHTGIREEYEKSVHGKAVRLGVREAPVCTDCHGEHTILGHLDPESPVYSTKLAKEVCGRCHDSVVINRKYNLPASNVETFFESYHGLAGKLGDTTVANCASCHGVHNILPSSDPDSQIHPTHLLNTCGQCHEGVTQKFVAGMIHIDPKSRDSTIAWLTGIVRQIYIILIVLSIGGMLFHNLVIIYRHVRDKYRKQRHIPHVQRFPKVALVQHMLLTVSFVTLVITGFSLSFPDSIFSQIIQDYLKLGETERSWVHRGAGVLLILTMVWHTWVILFTRKGRQELAALWFRWRDLTDVFKNLGYHIGLPVEKPRFDRYDYSEKIEYWAFLWGGVVMIFTGLLMWFPAAAGAYLGLPRIWVEVSAVIHYYEAWLATLAILIWHFFFVVFHPEEYPMDMSWLTGKLSVKAMEERHPEELERLEKDGLVLGEGEPGSDPPAGQ
jgi:cytochrome b subunit of formate dehydrogenase